MQCGLLWYTHVSKTGGTSVQVMLQDAAGAAGWSFHDTLLLTFPDFDAADWPVPAERQHEVGVRDSAWEASPGWRSILHDLSQPYPRVVVHHHDGMPGLHNEGLRRFLSRTRTALASQGCELRMATALPQGQMRRQPCGGRCRRALGSGT